MGLIFILSLVFAFNEKLLSQRIFSKIFLSSRETSFKRSRLNGICLLKRLVHVLRHFPKRSLFKGSFLLLDRIFFFIRFWWLELNAVNSIFRKLREFVSGQGIYNLNKIVESEWLCLIYSNFAAFFDFSFFEHLVHFVGIKRTICFVDKPSFLIRRYLVLRNREGISDFIEIDVSVSHSGVVSEKTFVGNHFLIALLVLFIW